MNPANADIRLAR